MKYNSLQRLYLSFANLIAFKINYVIMQFGFPLKYVGILI